MTETVKTSHTTLVQTPSDPPRQQAPHFAFLDGLRGLVAIWIVLFHIKASNFVPQLSEALPLGLSAVLFDWGEYAIQVFFVMSGFVMAHSLRQASLSGTFLRRFALRRWVRLTPPYYGAIALLCLLSAYKVYRGWNQFVLLQEPQPWARLFAHLLYLPRILGFKFYDNVYWTLCLEVQFYLVFVLLLWLAQRLSRLPWLSHARAWVFVPWTVLGALYNLGQLPVPFIASIFWPWQYSFFLGVYAYWAYRRQLHWGWVWGYAAFIALTGPVNPALGWAAALSGLLILIAARLERLSSWLSGSAFQFLGQISYSLYLTHVNVMGLTFSLWLGRQGEGLPQELLGIGVSLAVCLAVATVFWWGVERPSMQWSRRLKRRA